MRASGTIADTATRVPNIGPPLRRRPRCGLQGFVKSFVGGTLSCECEYGDLPYHTTPVPGHVYVHSAGLRRARGLATRRQIDTSLSRE